jgi:tRNA(Ile2)-agmatinylcytidine synthase
VYKKAVTQVVLLDEIIAILHELNADYKGYKNMRGIIGATSSISWESSDKTFEIIAYREQKKWGTNRLVDEDSVKLMDKSTKNTFDNYDYKNRHNRIMPNSPCPILYGIRGDDVKELIYSSSIIKSEPIESWFIFETNQGTDDHLQNKEISEVSPFESVIINGTVEKSPYTIRGGHVLFKIKNSTGIIDCAAYEPTKEFRQIIRNLIIGDVVEIYGGVRKKPLTINIEKINIIKLNEISEKIENPFCPKCKKHMKSKGKYEGFKCKICGIKSNNALIKEKKRDIVVGFYEVPVCARRHLSKPLKRMKG